MSSEQDQPTAEPLQLTDPKAMRAVAHPVRMALLELFAVQETLTATEASEALGESPANCAFHLRTLAKYGFVEEAGGGRGRERPWRTTANTIRVSTTGLDDKQAELAADALGKVWIDRQLARIRSTLLASDWPPEWESGVGSHTSVLFLTPDEARGVMDEIGALMRPYIERRDNPSLRPDGALPVEFAVYEYLRQDLAALVPQTPGMSDPGEKIDVTQTET